jgi:hypothetical protein
MPLLNDPSTVAEIAALHDAYERALVANDVNSLNASFWNSPHVVRFGINEQLYGIDEIAAYRSDSPPVIMNRRITRRTINSFGSDTATVMCELTQTVGGQPRQGRQSQLWIRFPDVGWKIVSAHVSNALAPASASWGSYVDQAAAASGIPLETSHRPGVVENVQRAAALAAPLLGFKIPTDIEVAPVFTP